MSKSTLLILGNQLFSLDIIQATSADSVFMAEDLGLCTYEKHHKLKILMFVSLIHISEPTRLGMASYAVFGLKNKNV